MTDSSPTPNELAAARYAVSQGYLTERRMQWALKELAAAKTTGQYTDLITVLVTAGLPAQHLAEMARVLHTGEAPLPPQVS